MVLRTLGAVALGATTFHRQKPLLLLAYLSLEGPQARRYMADLFYPETADPMNSLSRAVSHLRMIAAGVIEGDNTKVWTHTSCDASELLSLTDAKNYERALELYKGPFALDYALGLGTELEEWLYSTREILAAKARSIFIALGEQEAQKSNFSEAAQLAEKAYRLKEASLLEPDDFGRLYNLLHLGGSPLATEVRKEAKSFDIILEPGRNSAKVQVADVGAIPHDIPHNLPPAKTSFVGRDQELLEITQQLSQADCRLLTLHGMGGIGKSRTATEVAYQQLKQASGSMFIDGIFFVALDVLTSSDMIPATIAETIEVEMQGPDDILTQIKTFVAQKKFLLILDNFEHLIAGASLVSDLLAACPNLKILVTSREVLKLEEEWVKDLEGLRYPQSKTVALEEAQQFEAVQLFNQRAKKAMLEFSPREDNIATIIEICQLVEGAPLALELAATWVRIMRLEDITLEIRSNLNFLVNQSRNVYERHQSIRAVFEHSWKLLTAREQEVFRKLAVFVGSFGRPAAAEVAGATLPVLVSLMDKSLLRVTQDGRYSRHFLIYEFSQEKLKEIPDDFTQTKQQHASFYLHFLSGGSEAILGGGQKEVLEQLEFEIENIYAAWPMFFESKDHQQLCLSIKTLSDFLSMKGRAQEGINLFSSALDFISNRKNPNVLVLTTLNYRIASLYQRMGNILKTQEYAEKNLSLLESTSHTVELGPVLRLLASIYFHQGDLLKAKTLYEAELEVYKGENNVRALGLTMNNLGLVHSQLGQYTEAEPYLLESISIARKLESLGGLAYNLHTLAVLYLLMNKPGQAETVLRESLDITRKIDYVRHIPLLLNDLAKALHQQGKSEEAHRCLHEALRQARSNKDEPAIAEVLTTFAMIKIDTNDLTQAENYLVRALSIGQALDDKSEILLQASRYFIKQGSLELGLQLAMFITNSAWKFVRDQSQELLAQHGAAATLSAFLDLEFLNSSTELEKLTVKVLQETPLTDTPTH